MEIGLILRFVTLVLLIIWKLYWFLNTKEASIKKPKTNNNPRIIEQIFANLATGYIFINLLGYVIFPFKNLFTQIIGFMLVILGFVEGIVARKTLDDNWTNSNEYQIKKDHELITKGIYGYVRHPIYGGILLMVPGVLLVTGSYTFVAGLIIMLLTFEAFARREEKILIKHFGKKYIQYMKTTKKFIPFIY
ncbi:MAG: isoprenylcysteine carboxylmethyltransferase family protein [Patescibacteria group bacterium]